MILPGGRFQVFVATRPVDFRKGMDSLAAVVQERLRLDPFSGAVFVFRAKRADRVKLLVWDGSGLTLIYKRLDQARFVWPRIEDGVMRLSPGQLGALFEGLDWKRVHSRRVDRYDTGRKVMVLIYLTIGIAMLHVLFLIVEVVFWPELRQRLTKHIKDADTMIGKLFQNQGVYNGFLAAGL